MRIKVSSYLRCCPTCRPWFRIQRRATLQACTHAQDKFKIQAKLARGPEVTSKQEHHVRSCCAFKLYIAVCSGHSIGLKALWTACAFNKPATDTGERGRNIRDLDLIVRIPMPAIATAQATPVQKANDPQLNSYGEHRTRAAYEAAQKPRPLRVEV